MSQRDGFSSVLMRSLKGDVTNAAQYGTLELSSLLSTVAVDQQCLSLSTVGSFPRVTSCLNECQSACACVRECLRAQQEV